jgi:eukaryotic-like serine/threonine-protein kinase
VNADFASAKTEIGSAPTAQPPTKRDGAEERGITSQATRKEEIEVQGTPSPSALGTLAGQSGMAKRIDTTPKIIGGYEIGATLGVGGMGVVYKATDLKLKRTVALKLIRTGSDASPDEMVRFRGEAEMVAQLQHPNIVHIYEIGMHEGQAFIVFEYVDGGNLADRIQGKPQPPRQAAEMAETLARAMHAAHQQHIIHRDLKPANILLTKGGTLKITDFGLAKQLGHSLGLSRTGDVMGTPSYMSPEQAAGQMENLGPSTDVYALGAILYEMLTGRPPFRGVTMFDTLEQVRSAEPAPLSRLVPKLHRDLGTVCLKCLQKSPAKRYANAQELADDLRRWLDGDAITARPVSRQEKVWRMLRRHPWQAAAAFACILAITLLTLLGLGQRERTYQQEVQDAQQKYIEVQRQKETELRNQQALMQRTMDNILSLVKEGGDLSAQKGLDPLYDKLLEFYGELIKQQKENKFADLPSLAEACLNLGDLLARCGRQPEALDVLTQARDQFGKLSQDFRSDPAQQRTFRFKQAAAQVKIGRLRLDMAQKEEAGQALLQARDDLAKLSAEQPGDLDCQRQLAEAWHLQGELHGSLQRKFDEAQKCYEKALEIRVALCRQGPKAGKQHDAYLRDLARGYGYKGDALLDQVRYREADADYWASHRIREKLAADGDHEARFQLSRSFSNFANYQMRLRSPQTALTFLKEALKIQEKLATEHAAMLDYLTALISTRARILDVHFQMLAQADEFHKETVRQTIRTMGEELDRLIEPYDPADTMEREKRPPQNLPHNLLRTLAEARFWIALAWADSHKDKAGTHRYRSKRLLDDLRKKQAKVAKGQGVDDPDLLYLDAMQNALQAELLLARPAEELLERDQLQAANSLKAAEDSLRQALDGRYRRKQLLDIRDDRAFQALRQHRREQFEKLISENGRQRLGAEGRPAGE